VKPTEPDEIVQPTEVPEDIPVSEGGGDEEGGEEGGVEGGVPGGVPGGVVGGVVGGVLGGVLGGVEGGTAPIPVSGDVKPPVIVKKVQPEYPEIARKAKIQGKVVVQAIINEQGDVESAEVLKSQPMLDASAIEAVKKWKYQPATLNGKPVKVYFTVQVNFSLQ
jgi:protein TonB